MLLSSASFFVDPYTQGPLEFRAFDLREDTVINGAFINKATEHLYPVINNVPIFIANRIPARFAQTYRAQLLELLDNLALLEAQIEKKPANFSFSAEWREAFEDGVRTVWGQTQQYRLEEHLADTQTQLADYPGMAVLDVGCGNGVLCRMLGQAGAQVFGIDYSESVWNAEKGSAHPSVCFLQADLHHLPFKDSFFDLAYSNGVLHHTPNTYRAFKAVLPKVKLGGKYYIWLYKRGNSFGFNLFLYGTDALRAIVNKLPPSLQKKIIEGLVSAKVGYNRLLVRQVADVATAKLELYDTLTPRYKFYHTVQEVFEWHANEGLEKSAHTHSNLYGFGVVGTRAK
jgi:SAM-dependent methyltransferase